MKVLVIGGSGFIGGDAALRLAALGHEVTVGARRPPPSSTGMAALPFLEGDYVAGAFRDADLARFDAVVFTAGNDAKQRGPGEDEVAHLERANVIGLPRFFARLRDAGVRRAVYVGSFYPQVVPEMIEKSVYVRSRSLADQAIRALAGGGFEVCSVNPPYIVGWVAGLDNPWLRSHAEYALARDPVWAIPGGVNFMSLDSLSDAIIGALDRGEPGRGYLVGDVNLAFRDYFMAFRRAAGLFDDVPVHDRPHPVLPDWALYAGRGKLAHFVPPADTVALLGYRRNDLDNGVRQVLAGVGLLERR